MAYCGTKKSVSHASQPVSQPRPFTWTAGSTARRNVTFAMDVIGMTWVRALHGDTLVGIKGMGPLFGLDLTKSLC